MGPILFMFQNITSIGKGNAKLCFCSNRIGNLVAMATYSSQRLIMGKEETDIFFIFSVSMGIFGFFTEILIEKSSTFHITFVLIVEFDWLSGDKKG